MKKFALIIVLLTILVTSGVAYAVTLQQPTSYSIDKIEAYRHIVETDDQLYLVNYTITYATLPTTSAQDAWLFSLMNGTTVLKSNPPYAYHTLGYNQGVTSIYFPATHVNLPAWQGSYSVNMSGASTVSWNGTTPYTSNSTISLWSTATTQAETSNELTTRVRFLATQLSNSWGSDNLTTTTATGATILSSAGITYFSNIIPRLSVTCLTLLDSGTSYPVPDIKTKNTSAATVNDNKLVGTPFDMTKIGTFLGISREWATALIWTIFWLAMTASITFKLQAPRIPLFVFGFAEIGGAITGFMGMLAGVSVGLFGALAIVFAFFYKDSP